MKNKFFIFVLLLLFLTSCVGTSSKGIFGTGVTIAYDPRTLGTQIDDSIMDKDLDTRLLLMNKKLPFINKYKSVRWENIYYR